MINNAQPSIPSFEIQATECLPDLFGSRFTQLREFFNKDVATRERQQNICLKDGKPKRPEDYNRQNKPLQKTAGPYTYFSSTKQTNRNTTQRDRNSRTDRRFHCIFCDGNHYSVACLKRMRTEERLEKVKEKSGCVQCLKVGHSVDNCRKVVVCSQCQGNNYKIVCLSANRVNTNLNIEGSCQLLPTGHITVETESSKQQIRFLLDSGSQRTYMVTTYLHSRQVCRSIEATTGEPRVALHTCLRGSSAKQTSTLAGD